MFSPAGVRDDANVGMGPGNPTTTTRTTRRPARRPSRHRPTAACPEPSPPDGLLLFLPSADQLATAEGDITDARDPALTFTPNVLAAAVGFKRSRLTRRYVDAATERDFVAFAARDRWQRVPSSLAFVLGLSYYIFNWRLPFGTPLEKVGWVVAMAQYFWCFVAAVLSSAGVVDRIPWRRLRRLLSPHVRGVLMATILAVLLPFVPLAFIFREDATRIDRMIRSAPPFPAVPGVVESPAATGTTQLVLRPPDDHFIGAPMEIILFPARWVIYGPVATLCVAAISLNHAVRFDDGSDIDGLWYAVVVTAYVAGGLIAHLWEEQQRAHFRARASAAWQAGRGAKLVQLINDMCRRCAAAATVGVVPAHRQAPPLASATMTMTVVAFKSRFGSHAQGPEAAAASMLRLKACLVRSAGDVAAALKLRGATVFGGSGDSVLLAVAEGDEDSDTLQLGAERREVSAVLAAKLVFALVKDQLGEDCGWACGGIATGLLHRPAAQHAGGADVGPADWQGAAAVTARRLAEHAASTWDVNLLVASDIVRASERRASEQPTLPDGTTAGVLVVDGFELSPTLPESSRARDSHQLHRDSCYAVGDTRGPRTPQIFRSVEDGLMFHISSQRPRRNDGAVISRCSDGDNDVDSTAAVRRQHDTPRRGPRWITAAHEQAANDRATGDLELRPVYEARAAADDDGGGLVAADQAVSVKHVWRLLTGLTFEDDAVEARYRAQENAGPARYVVVFASAWYNAVLAAMYACRGVAGTGTLVWVFVAVAALCSVGIWAVLRPARPGQRRWAAATVGLFPLQSLALLCALHFHPDATNPAKLHQHSVTYVTNHVFLVTIPTTVPFLVALVLYGGPFMATGNFGARWVGENIDLSGAALGVVIYGVLINVVRVRARLAFADLVMSQRSAGRWARARRTLRQRLAGVLPAVVAEAAVLQLTARIGKARRGAGYSAIDAALEEEESAASSDDSLIRAGTAAGTTSDRRRAAAPTIDVSVGVSLHRSQQPTDDINDGVPPSQPTTDLSGDADDAEHMGDDEGVDTDHLEPSTSVRVRSAVVLVLDLRGDAAPSSVSPSHSTISDFGGSLVVPMATADPSPPQAPGLLDAATRRPADPAGDPRGRGEEQHAPAADGAALAAFRAVGSQLRRHPYTAADAGPGLFVSRYGPCGWLVVGGLGRRRRRDDGEDGGGGGGGAMAAMRQLRELACDVARLPEVEAHGGLRCGVATGAVAGDVVAVGGGGSELRYEVVGPAVEEAVAGLRAGALAAE